MACYDAGDYSCTYDSGDVGAGCGGGGCDYTVLATWEGDSDNDLAGTGITTLECYASQAHDNNITFSGASNVDETHFRRMRSHSSVGFDGTAANSAQIVSNNADIMVQISEGHARVEQIALKTFRTRNGADGLALALLTDSSKAIHVIGFDSNNPGTGNALSFLATESNCLFYECIVYGTVGGYGFSVNIDTGETAGVVCCTSVDNDTYGFFSNNNSGVAYAHSCYAMDNTTAAFNEANWDSPGSPGDWNGADDATADLGGTGVSFYNSLDLDASLDADYLATASIKYDDGGDLVGDTNCGRSPVNDLSGAWNPESFFTTPDALFGTSIEGTTRPAGADAFWDVGASEFAAADVEVEATTDPLVISEKSATVNAEISFTAGIDALILAEHAADVNLNVNVSAGVDALAISEKSATVKVEHNVEASIDPLILSALAAEINAETNVQAGVDALVLSTYSAGVTVSRLGDSGKMGMLLGVYP